MDPSSLLMEILSFVYSPSSLFWGAHVSCLREMFWKAVGAEDMIGVWTERGWLSQYLEVCATASR